MSQKPNIILCTCDQMRAHALGAYGNPVCRTPNIDRLAAEGTRFDLAFSSNPVCTPARSSFLTGQYSRTCAGMLRNVHRNPPNPRRERLLDPTLPEVLRAAGYRTAHIGKWHIDPQPQLIGFETALYPMVAHRHYGQTYFDEHAKPFTVDGFGPYWEMDRVGDFLDEQRDADRPFFLNYAISPPHQPIGPGHLPDRYVSMYDPDKVPLRPNTQVESAVRGGRWQLGELPYDRWWFSVYRSADFFWRELRKQDQAPEDVAPEDFDLRGLTALYYGACTFVDDLVGALMTALQSRGMDGNTVVLFTSDHGDNLGSHGLFNKSSLIEEAIRVPLVVRDPRMAPHGDGRAVTSLIDVTPTLLDLAGCSIPAAVQGQSLATPMQGKSGRDCSFIETGNMIGIRTRTHLYGMRFDADERRPVEGDEWFFDLREDPFELDNLAGTGRQMRLEEELRERLLTWNAETPWLEAPETDPGGSMADQMAEEP